MKTNEKNGVSKGSKGEVAKMVHILVSLKRFTGLIKDGLEIFQSLLSTLRSTLSIVGNEMCARGSLSIEAGRAKRVNTVHTYRVKALEHESRHVLSKEIFTSAVFVSRKATACDNCNAW